MHDEPRKFIEQIDTSTLPKEVLDYHGGSVECNLYEGASGALQYEYSGPNERKNSVSYCAKDKPRDDEQQLKEHASHDFHMMKRAELQSQVLDHLLGNSKLAFDKKHLINILWLLKEVIHNEDVEDMSTGWFSADDAFKSTCEIFGIDPELASKAIDDSENHPCLYESGPAEIEWTVEGMEERAEGTKRSKDFLRDKGREVLQRNAILETEWQNNVDLQAAVEKAKASAS